MADVKTIHWTLSVNRKEDRQKIELLSRRGRLIRRTDVLGRPVCWEYEMDAFDRITRDPVLITAWIGTGM